MNEEFAQKFVDLLCLHPTYMKPCVSFGQDNDLVYCTVPATSTQGAISAEDKAKQARGGVQLVRVSRRSKLHLVTECFEKFHRPLILPPPPPL